MTWGQNFNTRCAKDDWTAMPNLAALRAAIFLLSAKNRWGGGTYVPPPGRARAKEAGKNCFLLLLPSIAVAERAAGALARLRLPGSPTPSTCDRRGWENFWKLSLGSGSRDRRCRWLGTGGGLPTDMMPTTPRVATHRLHVNSTLLSTILCYSAVWLVICYSILKSVSSKSTSKR